MKQLIGALTVQQVLTDQNIKVKDEQAEEEKEKGADNKTMQLQKDLKVVQMALATAKQVDTQNEEKYMRVAARIMQLKKELGEDVPQKQPNRKKSDKSLIAFDSLRK